jgi:hypothetical protein
MGTVLGLLFIALAAVAGIFVGTRSTVMDGRWIAAKLTEGAGDDGKIECDRAIRVGVSGAEFACTHSHDGMHRQVWYRLTRDGSLESLRSGPLRRGLPGAAADAAGESDDPEAAGDEPAADEEPGAGEERPAGGKGRREPGPRGNGSRRRAKAADE